MHCCQRSVDPFDVTQPIDFVDGTPINEDAFWERMRTRKLVLTVLFAVILVLETVYLGWFLADPATLNVVCHVVRVAYALYCLVIASRAVKQETVSYHAESIIHLTGLTAVAAVVLGLASLLPTKPPPQISSESADGFAWLRFLVFITYVATCVLSAGTPQGPPLHFEPADIYLPKEVSAVTNHELENVTGVTSASPWATLFFSYTTKVVMLGNVAESLEIGDLPIVPSSLRATVNYAKMKRTVKNVTLKIGSWSPKPGSGWNLGYRLIRLNAAPLTAQVLLAASSACLYYAPPFFLKNLISYFEADPERKNPGWGWVYVVGMFGTNAISYLLTGQLWSLSTTFLQVRFKIQLNSILFAKTLVRKDVASTAPPPKSKNADGTKKKKEKKDDEDDFSSKAQIMTLMTTDVDRLSEFAWHLFTLIDSPIEIVIGTYFVYKLLGVSCFFGLAVTCLFLPMNHFAGAVVVNAQDKLMKARDKRIALMNEFMAWERNFEAKVLKIRAKELKYQRLNYTIETLWNAIWNGTPILVTLVSFWHFTVVRQQDLTPSIAFTSIVVFNELKFALNALPETFINMLQSLVSMRRIEKYLNSHEIVPVPPLSEQSDTIAFQSCTVTWPQDRSGSSAGSSTASSAASTPRQKFVLIDLSLRFPKGELSLICGKLGSGKTLLLHALLGEADILTGQMLCPRSPPDAIASLQDVYRTEDWIVQGVCAYVPQAAWLRNASIKDNILFNLPFNAQRYRRTLEVCALVTDLEILEDGDESEIGERGVNLSGGQKARVSLARAVYSRASTLFLDDVLSAVDAHTAHHLYNTCLKGDLMQGRTVILVSHHVQLCAEGASYIVALDNGHVRFEGSREAFQTSGVIRTLVQSGFTDEKDIAPEKEEELVEAQLEAEEGSETSSTIAPTVTPSEATTAAEKKKPARKLVEEEKRAVGRIGKDIWLTYIKACGSPVYWSIFILVFVLGALSPVAENSWLKYWSNKVLEADGSRGPVFYVSVYAAVSLIVTTLRCIFRSSPACGCSLTLGLLETVLFTNIRFHDTVSRGRLLNRFGKDFEGIDSNLSDNFGRSFMYGIASVTTLITISVVGGLPFIIAALLLSSIYFNVAKVYGQTSRDMRRLDSVTRSPLYSIYGETIAGVAIVRSFGASSKFLRDMLRCVDTNANPYYWMWGVNRWLSIRFNMVSCAITGVTAAVAVLNPRIDAALAGFALTFASSITNDLLFMVRRFVGLEQSMVALERVKEYSELVREPPEFIEPRPPSSWPSKGAIKCEDLVIRYAPELPNVLHHLNFEIRPGEKIGILGRTGSGKSTLALSFFRFVEPTEGRILVDGLDIASIGLTDLRSKITIIPQDPTILSGSLRSTLDVFEEYQDAEIFEALRRVHLIRAGEVENQDDEEDAVNANMFRNLDSPVSEGGDNFSTGEKQLLCMARAILKRSKVLVMDEATASVDYATDELIGKTIRQEFSESTILTIAHRLRTVIDYDRVMLLDQGRIVEFGSPFALLGNSNSRFFALCKATGKDEFAVLKKMAGL
ncbi:multidrug resistance-associated ABC transporter [Hymenopellis radicata]|nr:multidrug resistance-associated ABC transporter [Hymenopellis radicata]